MSYMAFFSHIGHILRLLLILELVGLNLFIMFSVIRSSGLWTGRGMLVLLTFMVCEASLGLGVLVSMIHRSGNDLIRSFSLKILY